MKPSRLDDFLSSLDNPPPPPMYVVTVKTTEASEFEPVSDPLPYWEAIRVLDGQRRRVQNEEIWDCGMRNAKG